MEVVAGEWWSHTFGWGSLAVLACGAVLVSVEFAAPYAFLNDYPADIRERAPEPTAPQRRAGVVGGIAFVSSLIAGIGGVVWAWGAAHPGTGFVELALMALAIVLQFAILDLVIDWLIICTWRPRRLVYPGTEDCAGWRDYRFHLVEQLRPRALLVLLAASALIGLVVWWLT